MQIDSVNARWDPVRGALVATLPGQPYTRLIHQMTVEGPARSTLEMYRGYLPELPNRAVRISPAASRTWNSEGSPILLHASVPAIFIWTAGATDSTSRATVSLESEVR